jgi:hypothetical protein
MAVLAAFLAGVLLAIVYLIFTVPPLGLLLYHQLLMMLGCVALAGRWAMDPEGPRGTPKLLFFLLGVVSPVVHLLLASLLYVTPFKTHIFLLCPISFGVLALMGLGYESRNREAEARSCEEDLRGAEEAIEQDPGNAAAVLFKARLLEKAGMPEEALRLYRETHRMCTRTFSVFELKEAEARLGAAGRLRLPAPSSRRLSFPGLGPFTLPLNPWVLAILVTAPVAYLDRTLFVGVASVWLFVVWVERSATE